MGQFRVSNQLDSPLGVGISSRQGKDESGLAVAEVAPELVGNDLSS